MNQTNHHLYQWVGTTNRLLTVLLVASVVFWVGGSALGPEANLKINAVTLALILAPLALLMIANETLVQTIGRMRQEKRNGIRQLCFILAAGFSLLLWTAAIVLNQPMVLVFLLIPALQSQLLGSLVVAITHFCLVVTSLALSQFMVLELFRTATLGEKALIGFSALVLLGVVLSLSKLQHSQNTQVETLQSLASTDALTRLVNRRQFNHRIQAEVARAKRHHSPLSLALFDIDNFKHLNDFYGHPVGDRILKELGGLIANNVRESDIAARYGGEEFALVLPETAEKEASELLERLRQLIAETVFCLPDTPITFTVSIGVAELPSRQKHANALQLIEKADQALYQAKAQGKNKVYSLNHMLIHPTVGTMIR